MRLSQFSVCVALGFASLGQASTIFETSGPVDSLATFPFFGVTWTQTQTYNNVSISGVLGFSSPSGGLIAYLTDSIGPGTTQAGNEIANTTITGITAAPALVNLFTEPTLGPGTYFLTVQDTGGTQFGLTNSPVESLGSGVTSTCDYTLDSPFAPYPPATQGLIKVCTGIWVTIAVGSTPEPDTLGFSGAVLGLICLLARRKTVATK